MPRQNIDIINSKLKKALGMEYEAFWGLPHVEDRTKCLTRDQLYLQYRAEQKLAQTHGISRNTPKMLSRKIIKI